ncbi:MAG: VWA domain-containing protein [Chloroflexi bacterium]|nr:VWA domain-containing protein [Chloroflexota bacterium]
MASTETGHVLHNLLLFGRLLRRLGLDVHVGRMLDAVAVIEDIGVRRKSDFRFALRTLLVHRRDDLPLFDEAFEVFWRQRKDRKSTMDLRSMGEQRRYRQPEVGPPPPSQSPSGLDVETDAAEDELDRVDLTRTFSAREVLRKKDFSDYTPEEAAEARLMMASLTWDLGARRARRWQPGNGPALDLRRTIRQNVRFGGEIIQLSQRRRKENPRRLVLICDVSGSMERYTRMLLHFVHSLYRGLENQVEAFLFATRITRVTGQFGHRDLDRAVVEVSKAVPDWSGGTRIGQSLKTFNYRWARRTLGWGSIVLIVSDGWDRGEPSLLSDEMARLQRSCHRLVWLNPLAGSEEYEPTTQGMLAAGPYIDDLLPVNNLASLEDLASHLSGLSADRPSRRQRVWATPETQDQTSDPEPQQRSWHMDANPTFRHPMWGRGKTTPRDSD